MSQGKISTLVGETAIYGVSSIIGKFLNYLLVPLYTYKIVSSSGGYGVITNIYAYTGLLLVLLTFGMETTSFRFANKDGVGSSKAFSTSALAVGFVSLLFVALVCIFIRPIASAMYYSNHPEYIVIMAIVVALDSFQAIMFAYLRNEHRAIKFVILKLSFIILNIGMNLFIFFLAPNLHESCPQMMGWYNPEYQVGYVFIVNLICTSLVTFGFIPELKRLRGGMDFQLLKKMLNYTWPLLLLGLAGILNQVADKICYRFIVPGKEGEVQLGIYGACVKIAMIMAMITQAFRYAYEPFLFGEKKTDDSKGLQARVMKYFIIFTLFAFLAVMMYLDVLKYVINKDYWGGLRVVPIVMMAEIFMGIYFNLSFWYKLIDKTWWGAIISGVGCCALLAINFIFVPKYGYMACAWGGFAGYAICVVLSYLIGQKQYRVNYDLKSALGSFVLTIGLLLLSRLFKTDHLWLNLVINTALLLSYCAVIAFFDGDLVKGVAGMLKRKTSKNKSGTMPQKTA